MAAEAKGEKLIGTNPVAHQKYRISETLQAGIVLKGTEIKSLRAQAPGLRDSYVEISGGRGKGPLEAWLLNCHIGPYQHGNIWNHEPTRRRKLLLHRREIDRLHAATAMEGFTLVPTRMIFVKGRAKVEIGLGKGKKAHDRREDLKARSAAREMEKAVKRSR